MGLHSAKYRQFHISIFLGYLAKAPYEETNSPVHCRGPWWLPTASHPSGLSCLERPWAGWHCGGENPGSRLGRFGFGSGCAGHTRSGCCGYSRVSQTGEFWYRLIPEKEVAVSDSHIRNMGLKYDRGLCLTHCQWRERLSPDNCHFVNEGNNCHPQNLAVMSTRNIVTPGFLVRMMRWWANTQVRWPVFLAPREFTHWCFGCCSCGARAFCIAKWWGKADRWWMNKVSSSYMSTQSLPLENTPPPKQPKITILFHGGPLCELHLSFTLKVQDLCREIDSSLPPSLPHFLFHVPPFVWGFQSPN